MGAEKEQKLKGKVAIVTGGGAGIGKAIVHEFAMEGGRIIACDVDDACLEELRVEAQKTGYPVIPFKADVTSPNDVQDMVNETVRLFGIVDILVNNAAIQGPLGLITEIPLAGWEKVLRVNLTGMFLCSKAVLTHMIEHRQGNIINVSSPRTWRKLQVNRLQYRVSKYGVDGLTYVLAHQMKPFGICVNGMYPPATDTTMSKLLTPEERLRMRRPEEVSKLALFLALQTAETMNGVIVDFREWENSYGVTL